MAFRNAFQKIYRFITSGLVPEDLESKILLFFKLK